MDTVYLTEGDTLTIAEGGKFRAKDTSVNDGYYEYGNFVMQSSSTTNNAGTLIVENVLALGDEAALNVSGENATATVKTVKNAGGDISIADSATFTATDIVLGAGSTVTADSGSSLTAANLSALDDDGGSVSVKGGSTAYVTDSANLDNISFAVTDGTVGLGVDSSALSDYTSDAKATLVLDVAKTVNVGSGSLQVGSTADGDTVGSGDAYFGSDSALVLTSSSSTENTTGALTGNGNGTLTVKKGSQLVVKDQLLGSSYRHCLGLYPEH